MDPVPRPRRRRDGRRARGARVANRARPGSRRRPRRASAGEQARRSFGAQRRASVVPGPSTAGSLRRAVSIPTRPARPCIGGMARDSSAPKVTTPSRFPRRVARWPIATATPSATSAFRRSAVPNCIETEVSRTSQVTSTRSARSTRTCGSPVRAVDVPVDPANVVARNVRPHHRELRSGSQEVRPEVTGEQPLHASSDRDVERAQEPFGHRPGAGTGRGRPREERAGVPHPFLMPRWRARDRAAAWAPLRAPGRGSSRGSPPPRAPGTRARGGVAERRVRVPEDRRPPRTRARG